MSAYVIRDVKILDGTGLGFSATHTLVAATRLGGALMGRTRSRTSPSSRIAVRSR